MSARLSSIQRIRVNPNLPRREGPVITALGGSFRQYGLVKVTIYIERPSQGSARGLLPPIFQDPWTSRSGRPEIWPRRPFFRPFCYYPHSQSIHEPDTPDHSSSESSSSRGPATWARKSPR